MRIPEDLAKAFNLDPNLECYDNSTLDTIDSCIRKAYWKLIFQLHNDAAKPGLADRVGIAAHYGTSVHSAMDKFYSPLLYKHATYDKRKLLAVQAFSRKYAELLPDHDMIDEPYTHPNGVGMLMDYYDHYKNEDTFFVPIDTELCVIILVKDLDPWFYWISRLDGLVLRSAMDDYLLREFKTTKGGLQNKVDELRLARQVQGYDWSIVQPEFMSAHDPKPVHGVMADILAVRVKERDPEKLFKRDIIPINALQREMWFRETLVKIDRWRRVQRDAIAKIDQDMVSPLYQNHYFDRNTKECLRYGKCSFYELCVQGIANTSMEKYMPNEWNPLYAEKGIEGV